MEISQSVAGSKDSLSLHFQQEAVAGVKYDLPNLQIMSIYP